MRRGYLMKKKKQVLMNFAFMILNTTKILWETITSLLNLRVGRIILKIQLFLTQVLSLSMISIKLTKLNSLSKGNEHFLLLRIVDSKSFLFLLINLEIAVVNLVPNLHFEELIFLKIMSADLAQIMEIEPVHLLQKMDLMSISQLLSAAKMTIQIQMEYVLISVQQA